jgi:hypothetical protein
LTQSVGCNNVAIDRLLLDGRDGFPDRIERPVEIARPPSKVWAALTTAEGLAAWFGNEASIDLRCAWRMTAWTTSAKCSRICSYTS